MSDKERCVKMNTGKRRIKAEIDGKEYVVVGHKTEEHVKVAAQLVNEQYRQIRKLAKDLNEKDSALLVALNTVSKQIELETEILQLKKKVHQLEERTGVERDVLSENRTAVMSEPHTQTTIEQHLEDDYVPAIYAKSGGENG